MTPGALQLAVGLGHWPVEVPAGRRVELCRRPYAAPVATAAELVRAALEQPLDFEPLRRAVTPDDRVAVVLDPHLPEVANIVTEVLAHLGTAGIPPTAVTVITPPGTTTDWARDLPSEFAAVGRETHDPGNKARLAYLASTRAGRRLYLNRTLVEADFVIVICGRGFDPLNDYSGAEAAIFPALADTETRSALADELTTRPPGEAPGSVRAEAGEVMDLLGFLFLIQVIEGEGDQVQEVVAGPPASAAEGIRRLTSRWHCTVAELADTVVATISGDPARTRFFDLAQAAACARRVTPPGGRIAVLTTAAPDLGLGAELLRRTRKPALVRRLLAKHNPPDRAAALLWAYAASDRSLYLASGYPADVTEDLFATPLHSPDELQRLIDTGGRILVIPDAHKTLVTPVGAMA